MKVGIDNYGLLPLGLSPHETMEWALKNGAAGVAFSGIPGRPNRHYDKGLLRDVKDFAKDNDMYLEWGGGQHFPLDMQNWGAKEILSQNQLMAEEAAFLRVQIVRSCSGGLMRWQNNSPDTSLFINQMADELRKLHPIIKDLGVIWAVETHFELTSFELLKVFELLGIGPGEGIGICLDTMNLLTMLENPVDAVKRLLPWIVSTHIKDGGLLSSSNGLISFPAAIDQGYIHLPDIIKELYHTFPELNLSIEDHNGSFDLPINDQVFRNKFPNLNDRELSKLFTLAQEAESERSVIERNFMDRNLWRDVCESRMTENIRRLKEIVVNLNIQ